MTTTFINNYILELIFSEAIELIDNYLILLYLSLSLEAFIFL